jgi:SAM-dependent methyltransferase
LTLASFPTWFAGRAEADASLYRPRPTDPEKASFTLAVTFRGLRRQLQRLSSTGRASRWSNYLDTQTHYTPEQFAAKESFVTSALREFHPPRVLDVGANTGHFSELAALSGASVVAIDSDSAAVGRLWLRASEKKLDILPLVVDLCRPTPSLGWRNRESPSFLDRATAGFDMVMMLAVVHHMLVTERIPLEEILSLAATLSTDLLLIEFVEPDDPMFRRLVRGRDALYDHLTAAYFESAAAASFQILRKQTIAPSCRTLYLLRRRT